MNITNDVGTIEFDTQKYIDVQYDELEKDLNDLENKFDFHCAFPFWGAVAGIANNIFAIIKVISFAYNNSSILLNKRAIGIIPHFVVDRTFANAALVPLPPIGTIIYITKRSMIPSVSNYKVHVFTGHEHKLMPYSSLVAKDWKFDGTDQELVAKARGMYQVEVLKHGGEKSIPLEHRLAIARGIASTLTC